jgi:hypothetical protein
MAPFKTSKRRHTVSRGEESGEAVFNEMLAAGWLSDAEVSIVAHRLESAP